MKRTKVTRRMALGVIAAALIAGCGGSKSSPPASTKGTDVFPPVSSANSVARDANNRATTTLP